VETAFKRKMNMIRSRESIPLPEYCTPTTGDSWFTEYGMSGKTFLIKIPTEIPLQKCNRTKFKETIPQET
jgi:hypothetical protein